MKTMEMVVRSQRYNQWVYGALKIAGGFLIAMSLIRYIYFYMSYTQFGLVEKDVIIQAFLTGVRFDLLVLGFFYLPVAVLGPYWTRHRIWSLRLYLTAVWLFIMGAAFISFPHFVQTGYHYRWDSEGTMLPRSGLGPISEGVALGLFLFFLVVQLKKIWGMEWPDGDSKNLGLSPKVEVIWRYLWPLLLVAFMARGKLGPQHLGKEDARISPWDSVNELSVNAVWCLDK